MKKIISVLIVILLIAIVWFSWNNISKKDVMQTTPEQALDQATQADTTDDIGNKLDTLDIEADSDADFKNVDSEIKSI